MEIKIKPRNSEVLNSVDIMYGLKWYQKLYVEFLLLIKDKVTININDEERIKIY